MGASVIPADISIRRMAGTDAPLYRDIRLEALQRSPEAFGSTFESENSQPLTWFADRLGSAEVLGAFYDAEILGIAGFFVQHGLKRSHKGMLWGMYVRSNARSAGVGRQLGEAIIDLARSRVELIQLSVVQDNAHARRLYASLGFAEYGVERNALKQNGRYYDEILMAKALTQNSN
jgi:GNAT superfamily N-acetyltransferase